MGGDYVGPLKAVHIDAAAVLRLTYWPGNDALKGAVPAAPVPPGAVFRQNSTEGFVLEGTVSVLATP